MKDKYDSRQTNGWNTMSNTIRYRSKQVVYVTSYYLHCKALHSLHKFASKTQRIQVGNGQHVSVFS